MQRRPTMLRLRRHVGSSATTCIGLLKGGFRAWRTVNMQWTCLNQRTSLNRHKVQCPYLVWMHSSPWTGMVLLGVVVAFSFILGWKCVGIKRKERFSHEWSITHDIHGVVRWLGEGWMPLSTHASLHPPMLTSLVILWVLPHIFCYSLEYVSTNVGSVKLVV